MSTHQGAGEPARLWHAMQCIPHAAAESLDTLVGQPLVPRFVDQFCLDYTIYAEHLVEQQQQRAQLVSGREDQGRAQVSVCRRVFSASMLAGHNCRQAEMCMSWPPRPGPAALFFSVVHINQERLINEVWNQRLADNRGVGFALRGAEIEVRYAALVTGLMSPSPVWRPQPGHTSSTPMKCS